MMLFWILLAVMAGVLIWAPLAAYARSRDALHPLIYLCPMMLYQFVYRPVALQYSGALGFYFETEQLVFVQLINLAGIMLFCMGGLCNMLTWRERERLSPDRGKLSAPAKERILQLATTLGLVGVAAYVYSTMNVGGLVSAYSQAKGGGQVESGYMGEAPLLSLPAIALAMLVWRDQRMTYQRVAALLFFGSPLLIHGFLGARRGPTFAVLAALLASRYVASARRPKLHTVVATVFCLGVLMLFLLSNRSRIFLGADWADPILAEQAIASREEGGAGEDWTFSSGMMLTAHHEGRHFWGTRFATILFVRPIPRQLWPDKYEAVGMSWMADQSLMAGMGDNEWVNAVGWRPQRGSAAGFVSDLFLEFSYAGLAFCFGFGWLYSYLWRRYVIERNVWSILYLLAIILSIYVPTQSVSAWFHRFLFAGVPTLVLWRLYVASSMPMSPPSAQLRPLGALSRA